VESKQIKNLIMKRLFYVLFLIAGISLTSVNLSNAQDVKVKGACCTKAKATASTVNPGDNAAKVSTVALTTEGTTKTGCCAEKGSKMVEGKACTGVCSHKAGAVTEKNTTAKTDVVAEVKDKGK
jgi:hypothetical protein